MYVIKIRLAGFVLFFIGVIGEWPMGLNTWRSLESRKTINKDGRGYEGRLIGRFVFSLYFNVRIIFKISTHIQFFRLFIRHLIHLSLKRSFILYLWRNLNFGGYLGTGSFCSVVFFLTYPIKVLTDHLWGHVL